MMADSRPPTSFRLMFVAGESSGDRHAAHLIRELRAIQPALTCFGYGGKLMAEAGMEVDVNLAERLPIIGISQAFGHLPELHRLWRRACHMLAHRRPDALVLVDYPGFNLRLSKEAKRLGIPVIYYIAPQVWAWHGSRLHTMAESVDLLLCIFPFEEPLFRSAGLQAHYVGHPLLDRVSVPRPRQEVLAELGFDTGAQLIGLIPGSRHSELAYLLGDLLESARLIRERLPNSAFVIPRAHTVDRGFLAARLEPYAHLPIAIAESDLDSVRAAMDFAICKSGTSTLELALADVPMIIVYRVSWPTYVFARAVVRTRWIGLVNIIADEPLVPELLQRDATPEKIASLAVSLLSDRSALERMREGYERIRGLLGQGGASHRAATKILEFLATRSADRS